MAIWQRDVPKGSPKGFSPTSGSTQNSPVYATGDQARIEDPPVSDVPNAEPRLPLFFRSASNPSSLSHGFVVLLEIFLRQILVEIVAALVVAAIAR